MDDFSQFYGLTKKSVILTVGQFLHARIFGLHVRRFENYNNFWDRTIQLICRMMLAFISVGRHGTKKLASKLVGYLRLQKKILVPPNFKCHFLWSHLFWTSVKRCGSLLPQRASQNSQITTSSSLGSYNPIGALHDAPFYF